MLTLALFAVGAVNGVPSRFSPERVFDATAFELPLTSELSSLVVGLALKSAYFRQFKPQESQRSALASPFGAFHH